MQRDEFGKMGEVIRIRLPLHLETEVRIKANELSGRDRGNLCKDVWKYKAEEDWLEQKH